MYSNQFKSTSSDIFYDALIVVEKYRWEDSDTIMNRIAEELKVELDEAANLYFAVEEFHS